jgi:hypothetical protein
MEQKKNPKMALHVNHEFTKYSVGGPVGGRRWELQPAVQEDRAAGAGTARPCAAAGDRRGGGAVPQGAEETRGREREGKGGGFGQ